MTKAKYRVYICVGPNCGPKGSPKLAGMLERELETLGLDGEVSITMGGCQSHCETGPTMVVFPGPVFYEGMNLDRLRRVAKEHFANDTPVTEYFWDRTRPPRKIIPGNNGSVPIDIAASNRNKQEDRPRKPKPRKIYDVDDFKW
jgi:(2Fe-2S) ferredoxin